MQIHDRIRHIRMQKGYTQEYIAEKLGIDTVNYGRIERGQTKITVIRLEEIADILDISVVQLFENERDRHQDINHHTEELKELIKTSIETMREFLKQIKTLIF